MLAFFMFFSACHRDFPGDSGGEVELWFQADMPQERLLEAGVNDYEQSTTIKMGDMGVDEYSASFRKVACEDCPGQLRMIFRDYKKAEEIGEFDMDSSLFLGEWAFRGDDEEANQQASPTNPLSFRFSGFSEGTPPFSYQWEFGDGHVSTEANPIHTYGTSGDFEIKLKIQDVTGCSDQSSHKLSVGNNYFTCPYDFDVEHLGNRTLQFTAKRTDGNSFGQGLGFFWDLGFGGPLATVFADSAVIQFQFQFEGIFPVTLIVLDSCGCPCPVTRNVYTANQASCVSEIAFKTVPEDQEVSRVTIEWIDENGTFYSSYNPNGQPDGSQFQLIERVQYKPTPQGKNTYKFSAAFDCILYNPVNPNDSIIVSKAQSTFALEIPE